MRTHFSAIIVALLVAATSTLAQTGFVPAPSRVRLAELWRPAGSEGLTRIVGSVIDINNAPVPYAHVQLRDLSDGRIDQQATSDADGKYAFTVANPSTYVVEMVVLDGYIVALSNAGTLNRYETLQTLIQLPGRWDASSSRLTTRQPIANYFGMSAQTTMTAATLQRAQELDVPPADPGEPVSP